MVQTSTYQVNKFQRYNIQCREHSQYFILFFILVKYFIYVFTFGCAGPWLLHGLFSSFGARGLLSSWGA